MRIYNLIRNMWAYLKTHFFYSLFFEHIGRKTLIFTPLQINAPSSLSIGANTVIAQGAWLMGNDSCENVTLEIGNYCQIGHFSHIIAREKVKIEDSVLIADKVYISDCTHLYEDVQVPIYKQEVSVLGHVSIGEGAWIGENVAIMGAKVGKHCIIGANSVVNKDIPDYCVAVGAPAKVIKYYDQERKMWIRGEKRDN